MACSFSAQPNAPAARAVAGKGRSRRVSFRVRNQLDAAGFDAYGDDDGGFDFGGADDASLSRMLAELMESGNFGAEPDEAGNYDDAGYLGADGATCMPFACSYANLCR
jgi:hypothetical protein